MANGRRFKSGYFKRIGLFLLSAINTIVIAIVNNGNIWTDGRRYRRRPKVEMQFFLLIEYRIS